MRSLFAFAVRLRRPLALLGVSAAVLIVPLAGDRSRGQDPTATATKNEKAKPTPPDDPSKSDASLVKVTKGPLDIKLELKGQFEAKARHEIVLEPKAWLMPQRVVKVLPHGSRVKKGDVLLTFDNEKLDQAIDDAKVELALAEHALEIAELELPILEKTTPLDLEDAQRAKKIADEDLDHFLKVGRALSEEGARFALKSTEERLKYSKEELRQLEKMYKDKDLTEDTEEMILQRTRFEVEGAEFYLKSNRISTEQSLTKEIPRREVALREAATRSTLALQKAQGSLPIQLEQKRLALAKQKNDLTQSRRKNKDLAADRASFTVTAPADGILYYGRLLDGNWTTAALVGKLVNGSQVAPAEVALTIVEPSPIAFRATVEEKQLYRVHDGLEGFVEPSGYPDARLPVKLPQFSPVPENGKYEALFDVTLAESDPVLLPGMTGEVTVNVYKAAEALTVPQSAVFRDDDGSRYVWRVKKDTGGDKPKPEKRAVKVGRSGDGKVEILDGLGEGDEVRTSKP